MAARKSTNKEGTVPPKKEPAPPKPKTWKINVNGTGSWREPGTDYFTNTVTLEEAVTKVLAQYRTAHPKQALTHLSAAVTTDISFVQ